MCGFLVGAGAHLAVFEIEAKGRGRFIVDDDAGSAWLELDRLRGAFWTLVLHLFVLLDSCWRLLLRAVSFDFRTSYVWTDRLRHIFKGDEGLALELLVREEAERTVGSNMVSVNLLDFKDCLGFWHFWVLLLRLELV